MRQRKNKHSAENENVEFTEKSKGASGNYFKLWNLFVLFRVISAVYNPILDCDETFNYWEPLHFLMYGNGLQTWEYSPKYALRSYFYLLLHYVPGTLFGMISKKSAFYGIRVFLGLVCATCECLFCRSIEDRFGRKIAQYAMFFLLVIPGMFHASTAFLPSSFSMYSIMIVYATWLDTSKRFYDFGIFIGIVGVVIGWPYIGVMFIPFAIDVLKNGTQSWMKTVLFGARALIGVLLIEIGTNFCYYQRWVLPAANIVKYNVFGGEETSSELYGTEPWTFYIRNGFLNLNFVFIMAMASIAAIGIHAVMLGVSVKCSASRSFIFLSPMYMWFGIMMSQSHKEERFLFPIYPLFALAASYFVVVAEAMVKRKCLFGWIKRVLAVSIIALSMSRLFIQVYSYNVPLPLFSQLSVEISGNSKDTVVCIEKEWYRFPSHFVLPFNAHIEFLDSGFGGQLPKHFESTSTIPSHMNNLNRKESSRFVPLSDCDYVVDLQLPGQEAGWTKQNNYWQTMYTIPFLYAPLSKSTLYRAYYIPILSNKYNTHLPYSIYKRTSNEKK